MSPGYSCGCAGADVEFAVIGCSNQMRAVGRTEVLCVPSIVLGEDAEMLGGDIQPNIGDSAVFECERSDDGAHGRRLNDIRAPDDEFVVDPDKADRTFGARLF
mgnify:CR=1 FL=1